MAKVWSEFPFGVFFPLIYSAILYFMAGLQASAAAFWTFALIMILLTQVKASQPMPAKQILPPRVDGSLYTYNLNRRFPYTSCVRELFPHPFYSIKPSIKPTS